MLEDLLTIVIICYDPYLDAINLSSKFLKENLGTCKARVIYVTSEISEVEGFETILTNGDLSFCGRLKVAIENIKTKFALLLLDDYLIDQRINTEKLHKNVMFLEENNGEYCELFTYAKKPFGKKINNFMKLVSHKNKYRIVLQPSVFSKSLLERVLLKEPDTAWDVELLLMGEEFDEVKAYFSTNGSLHMLNYIDKGKATRKAWRALKKKGLWENQREVVPIGKTIKKYFADRFAFLIPERIKHFLKKGNVIYKG